MLNSYPSIYNLGHKAVADLLKHPVYVEEKVDGSQFSFGVDDLGVLHIRSKGATINPVDPPNMFQRSVDAVRAVADRLPKGVTFRGEALSKPKHNVLCYDRMPKGHVAIFDVSLPGENYMSAAVKQELAASLGFDVVPLLYSGMIENPEFLRTLLERESFLGGPKIEGVVIKPMEYNLFGVDKKVLFGKFVSEAFREKHQKEWKASPGISDIIQLLGAALCTEPRWQKAIQHLGESGSLENSPKDIGPLLKEIATDIEKEEVDFIKDKLYAWAWPQIKKLTTRGFPEWYKQRLLDSQFEGGE